MQIKLNRGEKLGNHTEELRIETVEKWETYKTLEQKAEMILFKNYTSPTSMRTQAAYKIRHQGIKWSGVCLMTLMELRNLMKQKEEILDYIVLETTAGQ